MARKLLSVLLSVLLVASVLAPITAVSADSETLLVVAASDNGSTGATSHARAAIPNLKQPGDIWYSAARAQCTPPGAAIATFMLGQAADVEGVRIAFYKANERIQTFTVEYSEDGLSWDTALDSAVSAQQASYVEGTAAEGYADGVHPAEDFVFDSPVYAKYLRVKLTGTTVVSTGASNGYSAFHLFEAYGEYDPDAEAEMADYSAVNAAIAAANALDSTEYTESSWENLEAVIDSVDYGLNCFNQAAVDSMAEDIYAAISALEYLVPEIVPTYSILHGVITAKDQNPLYGPDAALEDNAYWCCAGALGEYTDPEIIYILPIESALSNLKIRWYSGSARTYTFGISVSVDGETWTTVYANDTTASVSSNNTDFYNYPMNGVHAAYVKLIGVNNTADPTTKIAFNRIHVFGDEVQGGFIPPMPRADYSTLDNYRNIVRDFHEEYYTEESWQNITDLLDSIDENLTITEQAEVDQYAEDLRSAIEGLIFNDFGELQIAQAYDSILGDTHPAWTNGAILFTEPDYNLASYRVFTKPDHTDSMNIASWARIFCIPTDDAVIDPETGMYDKYEVINIIGNPDDPAVEVAPDEQVPQNPNLSDDAWGGYGFVLAIHWNVDSIFNGARSQYASQEFGSRNRQAFYEMALSAGDLVCLSGVYNPYFVDGEPIGDYGPCDLETDGVWIHRYGAYNGMGTPAETPIYRMSPQTNPDAVPGGPQYLARDQFDNFTSGAILTRYTAPSDTTPGDANGDGIIDLSDLTMVAKAVAGWIMGDEFVEANADCNCDGVIDLGDVTLLAKYIAGWNVTLGA